MQNEWIKIAICVAPLLVAGSLYAFAADGTTEAETATETGNGVTYRLVKSEPLSQEELKQLETTKMATTTPTDTTSTSNTPTQTVDQSVLDAHNPFLVYAPTTSGAGSGTESNSTPPASAPATPTPSTQFDLAMVKKLELNTNTEHGWLKLEFKNEKGKLKIDGQLASRKFELEGAAAEEMMNKLLGSFGLNNALTAALQGKQVTLDATTMQALSDLKIELTDGRKVEANTHAQKGNAGNNNGLHKGQEKHVEKDDKNKKDKKNGKGKGHDDDE